MSNVEHEELLAELREAYLLRKMATLSYSMALNNCAEKGITNKKMGDAVGLSEAAIRQWRYRNGENDG